MKFLVDAKLPFKLAQLLISKNYDVIHTDNLPNKEFTSDNELRIISLNQNRIIISKDSDFLDSHLINEIPQKLLIVTTGHILNKFLLQLFDKHFEEVVTLFETYNLIEFDNHQIIVHENKY